VKIFKRFAVLLAEIFAFGVMAIAALLLWASYYVDTDEFRSQFIASVEQYIGQPISLHGELNIALYPTLSLEILGLALDGPPEMGEVPLVELDTVHLSVRLLPLFDKRIEIRTIVVEGMNVHVVKRRNGEFNYQALLAKQRNRSSNNVSVDGKAFTVSLSGLEVVGALFDYWDVQTDDRLVLSEMALRTGTIKKGVPVPFTAKSALIWEAGDLKSHVTLQGFLHLGEAEEHFRLDGATLTASFEGGFLPQGAHPGELTANVSVDFDESKLKLDKLHVRFLGLEGEGNLETDNWTHDLRGFGHFRILPFAFDSTLQRYLPEYTLPLGKENQLADFSTDFEVNEAGFIMDGAVFSLADQVIKGDLGIHSFSHPWFSFDLEANTIDFDSYIPRDREGGRESVIWENIPIKELSSLAAKGQFSLEQGTIEGHSLRGLKLKLDTTQADLSAVFSASCDSYESLEANFKFHINPKFEQKRLMVGGEGDVVISSDERGFPFLETSSLKIGGQGALKAAFTLETAEYGLAEPIVNALQHLQGTVDFLQKAGTGALMHKSKVHLLRYSDMNGTLSFRPKEAHKEDSLLLDTRFSFRESGQTPKTFRLQGGGPVSLSLKDFIFRSNNLKMSGDTSGIFLSDSPDQVSFKGTMAFDSNKGISSLHKVTLQGLGATLSGDINFIDSKAATKTQGLFHLSVGDFRKILSILLGHPVQIADEKILKKMVLKGDFVVEDERFALNNIEGEVDDIPLSGMISGKGYINPSLSFSLKAGDFDLDKYLSLSSESPIEGKLDGSNHDSSPVALPLGFLRQLDGQGEIFFESFKLADVLAQNLEARLQARNGVIHISEISGQLHGGLVSGDWTGRAGKILETHLKLRVEKMQVGPLLEDMAGRDYVRGTTALDFDLTSSGRTDSDIVLNLNGKAWGEIREGSFKFTGYDTSTKPTQPESSRYDKQPAEAKLRRTIFKKAFAFFSVRDGVFTIDDYKLEAPPLLESKGTGQFSLPANTINVSIQNDFVAIPSVTINIVGKLSDPEVKVPTVKSLNETVLNILTLPEKSFKFLRDLFK